MWGKRFRQKRSKKIVSDFVEIDYFPRIFAQKSFPGAKNSLNFEVSLFSASSILYILTLDKKELLIQANHEQLWQVTVLPVIRNNCYHEQRVQYIVRAPIIVNVLQ